MAFLLTDCFDFLRSHPKFSWADKLLFIIIIYAFFRIVLIIIITTD
jgi:hypothetical protein